MQNHYFLSKRSIKLLTLFVLMVLLVFIFLSSAFKTTVSKRKMPPGNSVVFDRALRGAVVSSDGYTLSRSNKTYQATVYAQSIVPEKRELFIKLFSIYSKIPVETVKKSFLDKNNKPKKAYVTLSKTIDAATAIHLKSLAYKLRKLGVFRSVKNARGIDILYGLDIVENGEKREFPLKHTLTPVLGYIHNANIGRYSKVKGVKGLEKEYEKYLASTADGMVKGKRDAIGAIIRNRSSIRHKRRDGYNIHLNIPLDLQARIENILDTMKKNTDAEEIIAAVMDSSNGKVLTLASSNRYDPANISQDDIPKLDARFTEYPYEPGSVLKPITLSIAMDNKKVKPNTMFNIHHGKLRISDRFTITDDESYDFLTATDIIVHSSNVGIAQIAWKLTGKEFYEGLKRFGFGIPSGLDLPRDLSGKIRTPRELNNKVNRATHAYGYGMTATFAQLLKAYSAFNNNGVAVTPRLVNYIESDDGRKFTRESNDTAPLMAVSPETAQNMKRILVGVVKRGTGSATKYTGLDIGGKTGTAHIAERGDYTDRYNSSFFGFANDKKGHRYTIGVLVIEAKKYHRYFASKSAVPTFKAIINTLVETGYLQPDLTPVQQKDIEEKERKRRENARKRQIERTRRIKELLRKQRKLMKQRADRRKIEKTQIYEPEHDNSAGKEPASNIKKASENYPDMF